MIRIGNTYIGSRIGGNIGNHVIIDSAVIRIELERYLDVGIQLFKILNGLPVNIRLRLIGIIFSPERISNSLEVSAASGMVNGSNPLVP